MKVVYVSSVGGSDATTASVPFHLAVNGSIVAGQDTAVIVVGNSAELIADDAWMSVEGVGIPPLKDLMQKLREHSVPIYV